MKTRTQYIVQNIVFGYGSTMIGMLLSFISRTVFIYTLGDTYLGISGLFSNVLGILSFAELGIGTAMNYELYKPVANRDFEEIKSLMNFYKIAYRVIALVVAVVGLVICPFLKYIVNDGGVLSGNQIYIYYLIYLYNTVISYFVSYKFSLVNAEQKNYIFTAINTITNFITVAGQIIALLAFKNFLAYLLTAAVIGTVQKIGISLYLRKMYPYLLEKNVAKLSKNKLAPIKKNVKALIVHKIGEISVYQTDNIIISIFSGIRTVGIVSNYTLIISSVKSFVNIIFNSMVSSFGNLMTGADKERQYQLFRCYKFLGFWVFGFCSVALATLMTPFITLWVGESRTVSEFTIALLVADFYLVGQRACLNNVKVAGGVFWQDRYVAFVQAIVNLVVSVVMIRWIGLPGVYVGTVVQGLISTFIKPCMVYPALFQKSAAEYFRQGGGHLLTVVMSMVICRFLCGTLFGSVTLVNFVCQMAVVVVVPNAVFFVVYGRTSEFAYLKNTVKRMIKR